MAKPLLLLDFDRTLFDTASFVTWLWRTLAEEYGIDPMAEEKRSPEFYQHFGDWYDYDFFGHIATIPAIPKDAAVLAVALQRRAAGRSFLFPDAAGVLPQTDAIITFGNQPYQRFKLSFCPELAEVPTHIIQSAKGPFILETFGQVPAVLVDDKRLERELPPSVRFVHLDRAQQDPIVRHDGYVSISSLTLLAGVL